MPYRREDELDVRNSTNVSAKLLSKGRLTYPRQFLVDHFILSRIVRRVFRLQIFLNVIFESKFRTITLELKLFHDKFRCFPFIDPLFLSHSHLDIYTEQFTNKDFKDDPTISFNTPSHL